MIYLDDPLKREFYAAMAMEERWSNRTPAEHIDSQVDKVLPDFRERKEWLRKNGAGLDV